LVTTRAFGDLARGAPGRDALRERLPGPAVWLRQVHGVAVADADAVRAAGIEPQADASVARAAGTVCAITVADCMPVLFAAADASAVGIAHAGWRGLCAGVLEATAKALGGAGELIAWLGPAIGPRVYEVGDEVRAAFLRHDLEAANAFVATRPGHWLLDLYAVARQRLLACGVTRIHGGGLCTHSDSARFFSHRRDRSPGRMAAAIWLS
jgi:hypothetical protein